ncbi:hypothetical protein EML15_09195 [Corynebacterium sp. sy017]|uniref:hypothetical protein n=1 Tax=unclassified Corynebacterium TaxID=2624378 RepID=UPI00118544B4|nr:MULTISPECIES: hypothetical protein [unclassified Corynebacterium]MBP3089314.1 hypothetical protein [Corynebacterium sp. sy017]TSD90986.1 hypothetical protein ELY17_09405 [Corynebacterium sp. SY003]
MVLNRFAQRAAAAVVVGVLGVGFLSPSSVSATGGGTYSSNVFTDTVHGFWGGANCDTGSSCVKEVGDETQVTWQVQLSPLAMSENHIQTTRGAQIMIPSTVKDVSIKLTHMPIEGADLEESLVPAKMVDYQVPIVDSVEELTDNDTYKVSSFVKNPHGSLADDEGALYGVEPSSFEEQPEWDFYQIGLNVPGSFTFEVTGTVEAVGEDTYVPIRAENMLWKCAREGGGPGSAEEGCLSLKEYDWARTGELPPVTTAEQSAETRKAIVDLYAEQGTKHGLTGVGTCAATADIGRFDTIGSDIESPVGDRYQKYAKTFNIHLNPAVNYYGALLGSEDNCDQGFQHITLCSDEDVVS